jgi:hypothetical protein
MSRPIRNLWIFLAIITGLRIASIGMFDLTPDEAYYWTWATNFDWCYFDQPAGVAWAAGFFTKIFGTTTWGLRMGAVILGLVGTLFVYLTARKLDFTKSQAAGSAALVHIVPLLSAGHVLMLHDTVMVAAAGALIYAVTRAIFERSRFWWIATGVMAAVALYGKFSAVVLGLGIALFLILAKRYRNLLVSVDPYLSALIAAVLFAPVIAWNAKNDWIAVLAVRKLANASDLGFFDRFVNVLDFFGSQAGLVSPILFVMMLMAAAYALRRVNDKSQEKLAFLGCLFLGVFAYFVVQSLKAKVQGNWAALAYMPGILLLVRYASIRIEKRHRRFEKWYYAGLGIAGLMAVVFMLQPMVKIIPMPTGLDLTDQVYGWEELAARVDAEREKRPDLVLMARRYQLAGELMFYCKGNPEIYVANWSSRGNQFDLWNDWDALAGRPVLYVDTQGKSGKLWSHFAKAEPLPDFIRRRGDRDISTVHLTILENFTMSGMLESYFEDPAAYSAEKMRRRLAGENWGL